MSNADELVQQIKHRFDHEAAKQTLKEKYEAKMLFAAFGGLWRACPELIAQLQIWTIDELILVDEYGNPCRVDRNELEKQARMRWQEQMNAWLLEFEELQKQR